MQHIQNWAKRCLLLILVVACSAPEQVEEPRLIISDENLAEIVIQSRDLPNLSGCWEEIREGVNIRYSYAEIEEPIPYALLSLPQTYPLHANHAHRHTLSRAYDLKVIDFDALTQAEYKVDQGQQSEYIAIPQVADNDGGSELTSDLSRVHKVRFEKSAQRLMLYEREMQFNLSPCAES